MVQALAWVLLLVTLAGSGGAWWLSHQLEAAEVKLRACQDTKLTQNVRVETWQEAASAAQAGSARAAALATAAAASKLAEQQRLQGVKAATCADAVAEIRKGLKP